MTQRDTNGSRRTLNTPPGSVNMPSKRNFLSILFNRKDNDIQHFFNSEGSISQTAWQELGSGSSLSTRMKAMEQLELVVRNRRLQIENIEALFIETKDLYEIEEAKDVFLKTFITITECQLEQLGLAVRDTFFATIRSMGLTDLSLDWLVALSMNGDTVTGFEYDFMGLLLSWLREVLDLNVVDHRHAIRVLQLTQEAIKTNAGFVTNKEIDDVVHVVCLRICRKADHLTYECLLLLGIILKYGRIPDTKLLMLITTLCSVISEKKWSSLAWNLMQDLLRSHYGHNVIKLMLELLRNSANFSKKQVLVGTVYCLHTALWSRQHLENLRCHPTVVLPSIIPALKTGGPQVMNEVLTAIKRLITANGKSLQQLSWYCVLELLKEALKLCKEASCKEHYKEQYSRIHQLLSIIEDLYHDGDYGGSPEALYSLIEGCAEGRPIESIVALIDYRLACLDPLTPNWLQILSQLVQKFLDVSFPSTIREKAVSVMHTVYVKYHWLFERSVIEDFVYPVLDRCVDENDMNIQYQMLNVLFDVAKTMSLREFEDVDLFIKVMEIAGSFLALDLNISMGFENMEIVVGGVCEVLSERFSDLSSVHLHCIVHMLCEHVHLHYKHGFDCEIGCEIRERIFAALLALSCNPFSGQMVRTGELGDTQNMRIYRVGNDTNGDFEWGKICEIVTVAIEKEVWFPVITVILKRLCRILEVGDFISTAGVERLEKLKNTIIALYSRRHTLVSDTELASASSHKGEVDLAKYICPVFSRLINYYHDEVICKIVVDCVPSVLNGCQEAISACDLAVQIVPVCMAPLARLLVVYLASLYPSAVLAIPIIELASDCSSVPEFYQFFEVKHFRFIIDILAPYTDVHRFNTFIVAAAFRSLMRWYTKMPDTIKRTMYDYIVYKIKEGANTHLSSSISGKGYSDENNSSDYETPSLINYLADSSNRNNRVSNEDDVRDKLAEEMCKVLNTFMRHSKVSDAVSMQSLPSSKLVERCSNHWIVNDMVISITTYTEGQPNTMNRVAETDGRLLTETEIMKKSIIDRRRRHQSAVYRPSRKQTDLHRSAFDDSCAVITYQSKVVHNPVVSWTQIIIRHIFGKHSWYMRSLKDFVDDFGTGESFSDSDEGMSILKLLAVDSKATLISLGDKNKILRSLRNIDRISPLELHTVGVVYIAPGQTKESEILGNVYGSTRYASFIKLLGDPISLDDCPGGLAAGICGAFTYACMDELSKTVFHIATLMPKTDSDPLCNGKKKFIGNDFVSVVFNESGAPYILGTISGRFAHVALEVVPQDHEHLLISVHARKEIALWLAISRALLPDRQAATLVRKLILRAQLSVNVWRREEEMGPPYVGLIVERLRAIRAVAAHASHSYS